MQKRHAGSGVSPVEKKMRMGVPATAAARTAVVASSVGAVVPSVMTASKSENAVSVLNQYRHGLNYQVVSQVGPAHAPVFTVQVEVDGQVFCGTGVNKATARYNAAQAAVQALQPLITEDLKQRAANKIEKAEQKPKSDADDQIKFESEAKEDLVANDLGSAITVKDKDDESKRLRGKNSLKVLREIRPGVVVAEKHIYGVPPGTYVASTVVDGKEFEGRGASLSLAKALAAELAVRTLFNLEFEHSTGGFPVFVGDSSEYIRFRLEHTVAVWDDDKNPVMQLNELYYESAVYEFTDDGYELPDGTVVSDYGELRHGASVCVDGITAYGRGITKKDAKTAAAAEAVKQLKAYGLFQKRLTEKEINKAQRSTADVHGAGASQIKPYRMVVTGSSLQMNSTLAQLSSENALAKLNKLYPGSTYELVGSDTTDISNTNFTMQVVVNGQTYLGIGRAKKQARLDAAENALRSLGHWAESDEKAKATFRKVLFAARLGNTGKRSQKTVENHLPVRGGLQLRGRIQRGRAVMQLGRGGMLRGRGAIQGLGAMRRGVGQRGGVQHGAMQRGAKIGFSTGVRGLRGTAFVPQVSGLSRGRGVMKLRGVGAGVMGRGASLMSQGALNTVANSTFGVGFGSTRGRGLARGRGLKPTVDLTNFAEDCYSSFGASEFEIGQPSTSLKTVKSLMSLSGTTAKMEKPKNLMSVGTTWKQEVIKLGPGGQILKKAQAVNYYSDDYNSAIEAYSTDVGSELENYANNYSAYTSFDPASTGNEGFYSSNTGEGYDMSAAYGSLSAMPRRNARGTNRLLTRASRGATRGRSHGQLANQSMYSNHVASESQSMYGAAESESMYTDYGADYSQSMLSGYGDQAGQSIYSMHDQGAAEQTYDDAAATFDGGYGYSGYM